MKMIEGRTLERYVDRNPHNLTVDQFQFIIEDIFGKEDKGTIHDETFDFFQWQYGLPGRQEIFCKYIMDNYYKKYHDKNVLEVGCGRTAQLSKLLSYDFKMTAIDPKLEIKAFTGFSYIMGRFDEDMPIDKYDLIIGLEPCDATEHIVRACVKASKEFVVVLCGVQHDAINGKKFDDVFEWYDYLVSIDKDYLELDRLNMADFNPYVIKNKNSKCIVS